MRAFGAAAGLSLAAVSCGGGSAGPTPVAALATTTAAQQALADLVRDWARASRVEKIAMKGRIYAFRQKYPNEAPARTADALLGWVSMEQGDFAQAERQSALVQAVAGAGTTSDLARAVQGAALRRRGQPEDALRMLSPLVSKLIDPWARAMLNEEIVASALAAKRWQRALELMSVWLREAGPDEHDAVRLSIAQYLGLVPADELRKMLDRARGIEVALLAEEEREIRKLMAAELATYALEHRSVELAQHLLQTSGPLLGDQGEAIARLATEASKARVEARTVGLLLSLRTDETRRRAAEVADGIADGLGLPEAQPTRGAARLVSRDDHGSASRIDEALDGLSADGASILIAGVDGEEAAAAARFAEAHQIPVLLLRPPGREKAPAGRFTFVVGEDPAAVETALAAALIAKGATPAAIVAEDPRRHGTLPAGVTAIRACSEAASPWKPLGVAGVVLGAACAREAIAAAGTTGKVTFGAGLELERSLLPPASLFAAAGLYPIDSGPPVPSLAPWMHDHATPPSWWSGLGHDAAVLAWAGVRVLPEQGTEDPKEVAERRAQVARAIASAEADLWTTEARGFGGGRVLGRTVTVR